MSSSWKAYKIGMLGKVITGKTPSTKEKDNFGGDFPFITIPDLDSSVFIDKTERTLSGKGALKVKGSKLPKDAVMMSCIATVGKCGITTRPSFTNQQINSVVCNNFVEPKFLYYIFTQLGHQLEAAGGGGSVYTNVSKSRFSDIEVNLPPLPEQRAIAAVLSALDDKIELNRRMNATLEQLAQAFFNYWFINNPESKEWKDGFLRDDFNLIMGQSPPGSSYNENGEGVPFFQGRADFGSRYPSNRVYCTAPTRFARAGDTLVCVRAPVGDINVALENCAIGRGLASIRHKTGSRSYTYYLMQYIKPEFKNFEMEGTVFGSINKNSFLSLKIPLPPHYLIEQFETICYPVDQKIELNNKENKTLAELRDTLLPRLMSGRVRVKI